VPPRSFGANARLLPPVVRHSCSSLLEESTMQG
jgi:hypothetical protein